MDTTRISIARLLALDVPLSWQDAVAVVHEIAMLNDVTAVMNNRPPLVGPGTCFLTRTGEVELPETTESEAPEAVADLLRLLLAGREAPPALEDLAFARHSRDLTTDLATFSVGNRRAVIARLATKALAIADGARPVTAAAAPPSRDAAPVDDGPFLSEGNREHLASTRPVLVKSSPRGAIDPAAPATAIVVPPPFQASPRPAAPVVPVAPAPTSAVADHAIGTPGRWTRERAAPPVAAAPAPATGTDLELRRLRQRQHERARGSRRWSPRFALLARRFGRWVTWRPATPNPLVIGASVVLAAAIVSVLWRRAPAAPNAAGATTERARPRPAAPVSLPPAPSSPSTNAAPAGVGTTIPTPTAGGPANSVTAARPVPSSAPPARAGTVAATMAGSTPARPRPTLIVRRSTPVPDATPPVGRNDAASLVAAPPSTPPAPSSGERAVAPSPVGTAPPSRPAGASATSTPGPASRPPLTLYSANDTDVEPPVMRRQHLPSSMLESAVEAPDDWPFLELLIDAQGAVEQVRLHARQLAPGQTLYRHRMLLAAAKAWQFEPARRNGEPVRYVMRVPLEP